MNCPQKVRHYLGAFLFSGLKAFFRCSAVINPFRIFTVTIGNFDSAVK
jgi:hypothetical protein